MRLKGKNTDQSCKGRVSSFHPGCRLELLWIHQHPVLHTVSTPKMLLCHIFSNFFNFISSNENKPQTVLNTTMRSHLWVEINRAGELRFISDFSKPKRDLKHSTRRACQISVHWIKFQLDAVRGWAHDLTSLNIIVYLNNGAMLCISHKTVIRIIDSDCC